MYGSVICKKLAVLEIDIVTSNYINSTIQNHISNLALSNYVEDITQDLIAVSSVNIDIHAGDKVKISQAYNHASVNWGNDGNPSYFTIIPLKSGFP